MIVYKTKDGIEVPAVTADQMREVDRIAMEEFDLGILQMMENAGRNLAECARQMLGDSGKVTVLAGTGGNGGGGLCCARHLHNRGIEVTILLAREKNSLGDAAGHQLNTLEAAGIHPAEQSKTQDAVAGADLVIDALIGYSLRGTPSGRASNLIWLCNEHARSVLSLDVPSGLDATTGENPGQVVRPDRTLTLALPKTGLQSVPGELFMADIGIPPQVYHRLGISSEPLFTESYWIRLDRQRSYR
jgi:NAD(P)H-hydrate epimerase